MLLLLLFLAAALLGGRGCLIFFHLFTDFFLPLGADLCPLGALGFNHLFAAQQFDVAGGCAIACTPSLVDDAQIAAAAVAKTGRNSIKQAADGLARHQVAASKTASREVSALALCDQFFHVRTHGFGLGRRG